MFNVQRGVTLVEILAALGIVAASIAGVTYLVKEGQDASKAAATSEYMSAVVKAAESYIADNRTAVLAGATAVQPYLIRVNELVAAGYLSGLSATNAYGHSVCVLAMEPVPNRLQAIVVAEGGTALDDATLGQISTGVGADGGAIYSSNASLIQGMGGSWSIPAASFANANHAGLRCDGSVGSVQLQPGRPAAALLSLGAFGAGAQDGLLHRNAVPGRPDLNTMNTPLILNSVQTSGQSCSRTGALARDSSGGVMACVSGAWASAGNDSNLYWAAPANSVTALPVCNSANASQVRSVGVAAPRPYVCSGGVWRAVAIDENGNMTVPGVVQAGSLSVTGNASVGGNATVSGRLTAGEFIQVDGVVIPDSACSPNGLIGIDSTRALHHCISARWRPLQVMDQLTMVGNDAGSVQLPSGLIMKWGRFIAPMGTSNQTTFTSNYAFPTGAFPSLGGGCQAVFLSSERGHTMTNSYSSSTSTNISAIGRCAGNASFDYRLQSLDGQPIQSSTTNPAGSIWINYLAFGVAI